MARPKLVNPEVVSSIRRFYSSGDCTQTELASMFCLSQSTICKIVNYDIHKKVSNVAVTGKAEVKAVYHYDYKR